MIEELQFENKEIDIQELPKIEELQFKKVEKTYLYVLLIRIFIFGLIINGLGLYAYFTNALDIPTKVILYTLLAINVLFSFRIIMTIAAFNVRAYVLREKDITYQRGLLVFKQTTVSVNRMQHIELTQSLLLKLFHLSSLKIYTAGGNQSDISIAGISKEKAEEIKELLNEKLSQHV